MIMGYAINLPGNTVGGYYVRAQKARRAPLGVGGSFVFRGGPTVMKSTRAMMVLVRVSNDVSINVRCCRR